MNDGEYKGHILYYFKREDLILFVFWISPVILKAFFFGYVGDIWNPRL